MKRLLLGLVLVSLAGCAIVGRPIDSAAVSKISEGKTTVAEVEMLMGQPTSITTVDGTATYLYQYGHAHLGGPQYGEAVVVKFTSGGVAEKVTHTKYVNNGLR